MAGTTNDKGEVTLSDIPRGSRFELGFDDERFADPGVYNRIATSESDPVNPPTTVRLEAGARITGVVRFSSTGKAAADIEVAVESTNRTPRGSGGTGFTDAAGSYRISHLAPGEYNLLLHLDRETNQHWTAAAHEWVKVTGGQSLKDMDFALIEGGVIKGRVITADTAEALSGTMVGVYGPSHPRSSSSVQATQTDADGAYMLRIPPGAQHVYVMGGVPGAYRTLKPPFQDLKVEDGETVRVDFRLQRQHGETVNGIVIGLDGKPAAGIIVQVQTGTDISGFKSTHTDAQGRFHFDALPAAAPIEVKNGDLGTAEPAYARKGQSEIRLQLVRRMKLNLKGLVTDDDAKPLAGARVWLSTTYGNFGLGTGEPIVTAADGTYELKNVYADNQYHVSAHAEGFGGAGAPLDLPTGARDAPTLKLPRETTTIRGAVVDETGKPVPKAMVRMTNGMAPKTCETDGQGKFSFSAVAGKNYLITAVVKQQGNFPPHASGIGGGDEVKLVLPRDER
jgi:protocatechuate 3,4-dioxygenase beta subunit